MTLDSRKLTKLVSKNAYLAASTGWYYENGVVLVKTARDLHQHVLPRSGCPEPLRSAAARPCMDTFGTPELVTPSLWNAPGQATEVTATFHNAGTTTMRDVRLALDLPEGWTASGSSTFAKVDPGKTVTTKLQVTPAASVKPASFTLKLNASYKVHDSTYTNSTVGAAQLPYASLSQAATVVGVTDATTYAKGNFDGSGNSFNGEALAAAGYTPGAKVTVQGAEFTWPTGAPGTPNVVKDQSAPILVSGTGSHLALLGAGASLNAKGSVTVIYTDGTESQSTAATAELVLPGPNHGRRCSCCLGQGSLHTGWSGEHDH